MASRRLVSFGLQALRDPWSLSRGPFEGVLHSWRPLMTTLIGSQTRKDRKQPLKVSSSWVKTVLQRHLQTAAGGHIAIKVDVGATVKVLVSGSKAVEVGVSSSLEHVQVDSGGSNMRCSGSGKELTLEGAEKELVLRLRIPERWCGLEVQAGEGSVHVQKVVEGNLSVQTKGGDVTLGTIRGGFARIETGRGSLTASNVSCELVAHSDGGPIKVDRLVGPSLRLSSGGGNIALSSVYGNDITLDSGKGDIYMNTVHAAEMLKVSSGGGSVAVNGLDGNVYIDSSGGNVHLQLLDGAKQVEVRSGNGDVVLFAPSALQLEVDRSGEGPFFQEPNTGANEPAFVHSRLGDGTQMCTVTVHHGRGRLELRKRSWLASLGEKYAFASGAPSPS